VVLSLGTIATPATGAETAEMAETAASSALWPDNTEPMLNHDEPTGHFWLWRR